MSEIAIGSIWEINNLAPIHYSFVNDKMLLAISKCGQWWASTIRNIDIHDFEVACNTKNDNIGKWYNINDRHEYFSSHWQAFEAVLSSGQLEEKATIKCLWRASNSSNNTLKTLIQNKKETDMSNVKSALIAGMKDGGKQVAFDECGELLLDAASVVLGADNPVMASEQGREMAKVAAAYMFMAVSEHMDIGLPKKLFADAARLQTQTAFVRLLGSHTKKLRELVVDFGAKLKETIKED